MNALLPVALGVLLAAALALSFTGLIAAFNGQPIRGTFLCFFRRRHEPRRHPLGGFRCADCGHAGDDMAAFGFGVGSGYVTPPAFHEARAAMRDVRPVDWTQDLRFYRPARDAARRP